MWWHSQVCSLSLLYRFLYFPLVVYLLVYLLWVITYWLDVIYSWQLTFINECHLFIGGVLLLELFIGDLLLLMTIIYLSVIVLLTFGTWFGNFYSFSGCISFILVLELYLVSGCRIWYVRLLLVECLFNFGYLFLSVVVYSWVRFVY